MRTNHPLHHRHIRRRIHQKHEAYPSTSVGIRLLDKVIYVVGFLGPISTIPQIYTIYVNHNVSGISIISWSLYAFFNIVWVIYGLAHRENAITFTFTLWFIMNTLVALGAFLYR